MNLLSVALLTSINITAEFQNLIEKSIPEIIQLANDSDWRVCGGAAEALLTLSEHCERANTKMLVLVLLMKIIAELRASICTAIPGIVKLFRDDPTTGIGTLLKLLEQGKTVCLSNLPFS